MYRNSVKIALVLVYLVIVAGAVVRMTGSGMGCPDWPKCFGYYIPPTQESELLFQADRDYKRGQVIIIDESLKVAKSDFTSAEHYNPENWENYTRHDYAIFNPSHTWTEYINRLVGALAGLAVLIMAVLSFRKWKTRKRLCILSWLSVFLMVFQAWLGATVVYSVLAPVRITLHMVMALVIVAILLYILADSSAKIYAFKVSKSFKAVVLVSIILSLIQVTVGPGGHQVGVGNKHAWGVFMGFKDTYWFTGLHQQCLGVFQAFERFNNLVVALPVTRSAANATVYHQVLGAFSHVRVEVVH